MRIVVALAVLFAVAASSSAGAAGLVVREIGGWDYVYTGVIFRYDPTPLSGAAEIGVRIAASAPPPVRNDFISVSGFEMMRKWRWIIALERDAPGEWVSGDGYCSSNYENNILVLTCLNVNHE